MTPEIRAQVIESRRRQGLPDTIEDPVFLTKLAAILLDDTTPGAGSSLGTAPTGTSAGRRAPGWVVEPAPVSHGGPNGDQPDDPWSPPGEPSGPGEPEPWVPNPTDRMTPMFRAAATPDAAASSVTAGTSSPAGEAPDGPGPAAALNPPPTRRWWILVDDDILWTLDPRRVTVVQVAGGAL